MKKIILISVIAWSFSSQGFAEEPIKLQSNFVGDKENTLDSMLLNLLPTINKLESRKESRNLILFASIFVVFLVIAVLVLLLSSNGSDAISPLPGARRGKGGS